MILSRAPFTCAFRLDVDDAPVLQNEVAVRILNWVRRACWHGGHSGAARSYGRMSLDRGADLRSRLV